MLITISFVSTLIPKTYLAWVYYNIGSLFKRQELYEESLEYFKKSEKILVKFNQTAPLASTLNNMGIIYSHLGNHNNRLKYFEKALTLTSDSASEFDIKICLYHNISGVYLERCEYDKAMAYVDSANQQLINEKKYPYSRLASNFILRSYILLGTKNYEKAIKWLEKAEKHIAKSNKKKQLKLREIYHCYYNIYDELGESTKALFYYKKYIALNDSIHNTALVKDLVKFNFNQGEGSVKKAGINEVFNLNNWLIIVSVLLVFLGAMLMYLRIWPNLFQEKLALTQDCHSIELAADRINHLVSDKNGEKYINSPLEKEQAEKMLIDLLSIIETDQIFKNQDLTIKKVANLLHTNRTYLSQVINQKLNKSFITLINEYRIKEAQIMLANESNSYLTIEAISHETGFKSLSAFNYAFKKFTGVTPSSFLRSSKTKANTTEKLS